MRGGGRVKRITESTQVKEPLQLESHLHKLREKKKKLAHESISIKDQKEQEEKKGALLLLFPGPTADGVGDFFFPSVLPSSSSS